MSSLLTVKTILQLSNHEKKHLLPYSQVYFSQFGEDTVILEYINRGILPEKGRFIDIGCYHPILWSNTFALYMMGWRGINIDANEQCISMQKAIRPKDINICIGIAEQESSQTFYSIGMQAASTIVPSHKEKQLQRGAKLNGTKELQCRPIMSVLKENVSEEDRHQYLYMNIDLEGMDSIVVEQIDWDWLPIKLITVEVHDFDITQLNKSSVYNKLIQEGFKLEHFISPTAFFRRN
jgi:hypothetical protein